MAVTWILHSVVIQCAGPFDDCDGGEEGEKECVVEVVMECGGDGGSKTPRMLTDSGTELLIYYTN